MDSRDCWNETLIGSRGTGLYLTVCSVFVIHYSRLYLSFDPGYLFNFISTFAAAAFSGNY